MTNYLLFIGVALHSVSEGCALCYSSLLVPYFANAMLAVQAFKTEYRISFVHSAHKQPI